MGIAAGLRAIADEAKRDLAAIYDYFQHTTHVWQTFRESVAAGHRVEVASAVAGGKIDQDALSALADAYLRKFLITSSLRDLVSVFESFLFRFLRRLLDRNAWQFAKAQLEFDVLLRAADLDEAKDAVLGKQLNELRFKNVREWFAAIEKTIALGCPDADEIEQVAEIKASRDIMEHADALVNLTYVRKAGGKARYAVGEVMEIDDDYHLAAWRLMLKIADDMAAAVEARMK
ncbi:MAG: hypothetical protein K2W96_25920 [Gemmataceae bacterium]|nr:hypothetical protein [Gemmataceae bacterium]